MNPEAGALLIRPKYFTWVGRVLNCVVHVLCVLSVYAWHWHPFNARIIKFNCSDDYKLLRAKDRHLRLTTMQENPAWLTCQAIILHWKLISNWWIKEKERRKVKKFRFIFRWKPPENISTHNSILPRLESNRYSILFKPNYHFRTMRCSLMKEIHLVNRSMQEYSEGRLSIPTRWIIDL